MYIVAIAWMYVVMMVSFLQPTIFRGVVTFFGAGIFPLALLLFLVGTPQRRRNKEHLAEQTANANETNSETSDSSIAPEAKPPQDLAKSDLPADQPAKL
jgi:hypothetical protein